MIKNLSKRLLKIVYEYYVNQNSTDFLSIDDILIRADDFGEPNRIMAALDYLVLKGFIIPDKGEDISYKIMPAGLEFYESESQEKESRNGSVTYNDVGTYNNTNYGQQVEHRDNTNNQLFIGKEFMKHYDVMISFIKDYRDLVEELKDQQAISPEKEEELLDKVNDVEAVIRSHDLDGE